MDALREASDQKSASKQRHSHAVVAQQVTCHYDATYAPGS